MSQSGPASSEKVSRRFPWLLPVLVVALLASAVVIAVYLHRTSPAKSLARVRGDWEALRKALSTICVDWSSFPSDTSVRRHSDPSIPLTFESDVRILPPTPTPSATWPPKPDRNPPMKWPPHLLTSPVAYMTRIPEDPFMSGALYGYTCFDWKDKVPPLVILHSAGPDGRYNITLPELRDKIAGYMTSRIWSGGGLGSQDRTVLKGLVAPHLYDPSNGTRSPGDLVWLMDTGFDAFGWERNQGSWASAAPLDYTTSSPAEIALALEKWRLGMPLPPPSSAVEAINRTRLVPVPEPLAWHMGTAGMLERAASPPHVKASALETVRTKLSAIGADVWDRPRMLTPTEKAALDTGPRESHLWWGTLIPDLGTGMEGIRSLPANEVYQFVSLLGMTQVALALRDAEAGQTSQSVARIKYARLALEGIDERVATIREPAEKRIREELERLFSSAEKLLYDEVAK